MIRTPRTPIKDFKTKFLTKQIQALNKHLPRERKTLAELLKVKKDELERLSSLLPSYYHNKLKLPIYIELGPTEFGTGVGKIRGEEACIIISKVLGVKPQKDSVFIYRPDIRKFRKEFPTTTQYAFTMIGSEI